MPLAFDQSICSNSLKRELGGVERSEEKLRRVRKSEDELEERGVRKRS